jgi:HSP20 family molecular chaperone IbpA
MKDTKKQTVYFDDFNIKALYKTSLANKTLSNIKFRTFETATNYIIEMSIDNLTADDLIIELENKLVIITPKMGSPKLKLKRVFKIPSHIHAMDMKTEIKDQTLFIRIPKINLKHNGN